MRERLLFVILCAFIVTAAAPTATRADRVRTHENPGVGDYTREFWPGATYRTDVDSPSDFLGFELGGRAASHEEVMAYFDYLAERVSHVSFVRFGQTYEGRELAYLVVTSEQNARRLEEIRADIAQLADPRGTSEAQARAIIESTPAVAWMAYGIHGDELSSCDAALFLGYQLAAGNDAFTQRIRDEVVVLIDPLENPDGRTRWLAQLEAWNGVVPNEDYQSLNHQGAWPWGRTNHYLFDMNRDWFALVHPESRARVAAILDWNPQYLLDAHEMRWPATYLFSPPREPFNPYMIAHIYKWWDMLARDHADAFDRYGWNYYTREWNEEFYPGYGSSWGIYIGAVGMLFEQARASGGQVLQPDGNLLTYRETVHHQFVASMANLGTVAENRHVLLEDYFADKRRAVQTGRRGASAYVLPPTQNLGRLERFAETLLLQRIEVEQADAPFRVARARGVAGRVEGLELPAGTVIVRSAQPLRPLIETIMEFDIRLPTHVLEMERKEQLKHGRTKLYEATGWSLPLAYNLECYRTDVLPSVSTRPYEASDQPGGVDAASARFGYAFSGADDRSYGLLARLFEQDYTVWCARRPFQVNGRRFEAGSFVVKNIDNPVLDADALDALSRDAGVPVYAVNTALGVPLADLGGNELQLLEAPRIAIVGGPGTSSYGFGVVWHMLDSRLAYRASLLDLSGLGRHDLRHYNVLILPPTAGVETTKGLLGKRGIKALRDWVADGGTLVALGSAAAFAADSSVALTSVRPRSQVLADIETYDAWKAWLRDAESPSVDSLDVWEATGAGATRDENDEGGKQGSDPRKDPGLEALKRADDLAKRLAPRGAIVAAELDPEHWLGFGERGPVPVIVAGAVAFEAKRPVQVPARLAPPASLRLSGLLWSEARERWSETAYSTREPIGKGQVILFAYHPSFRGFFHGGERLLQNAIFLGPGFGARAPLDW